MSSFDPPFFCSGILPAASGLILPRRLPGALIEKAGASHLILRSYYTDPDWVRVPMEFLFFPCNGAYRMNCICGQPGRNAAALRDRYAPLFHLPHIWTEVSGTACAFALSLSSRNRVKNCMGCCIEILPQNYRIISGYVQRKHRLTRQRRGEQKARVFEEAASVQREVYCPLHAQDSHCPR